MRASSVLLGLCLVFFSAYSVFTTTLLIQQSDANKARHRVEQTQVVCVDSQDRIVTDDVSPWKECLPVVYRHADEAHVF